MSAVLSTPATRQPMWRPITTPASSAELIARLRNDGTSWAQPLFNEAANALERATAERDEARAVLRPFATEAERYDPDEGDGNDVLWGGMLRVKHLRAARAALLEGEAS